MEWIPNHDRMLDDPKDRQEELDDDDFDTEEKADRPDYEDDGGDY